MRGLCLCLRACVRACADACVCRYVQNYPAASQLVIKLKASHPKFANVRMPIIRHSMHTQHARTGSAHGTQPCDLAGPRRASQPALFPFSLHACTHACVPRPHPRTRRATQPAVSARAHERFRVLSHAHTSHARARSESRRCRLPQCMLHAASSAAQSYWRQCCKRFAASGCLRTRVPRRVHTLHAAYAVLLQFLQAHERTAAVEGLDLMSLLILPVQQLPR